MRAFKFTSPGAIGPFSGVAWPTPAAGGPGAWVSAAGEAPCRSAVHACRPQDLPWWIADELWEVELDGLGPAGRHKLTARRGRLVRRVTAWDAGAARAFAEACAWRAHERALVAAVATRADEAAAALRGCASAGDLAGLDREVAGPADVVALLGMAADAGFCATAGAPAPAAFAAARSAGRVAGDAGTDEERSRQVDWLVAHLTLAA